MDGIVTAGKFGGNYGSAIFSEPPNLWTGAYEPIVDKTAKFKFRQYYYVAFWETKPPNFLTFNISSCTVYCLQV